MKKHRLPSLSIEDFPTVRFAKTCTLLVLASCAFSEDNVLPS